MIDLYQRSIEIILANQSSSGAYVASPNFPTYHYCWFRDGSMTAYAMDLAGEHESAARFHAWAARAVNRRAEVIRRGVAKAAASQPLRDPTGVLRDPTGVLRDPTGVLREDEVLHTRLTLEGEDVPQQGWGNFQLDGFGTWLWALEQHRQLSGEPLPPAWLEAAGRVVEYLSALWRRPCYDCWEEFSDKVHPYTLSAIYGGLRAYGNLTAKDAKDAKEINKYKETFASFASLAVQDFNTVLKEIKAYIEEHFVCEGHFVKFEGQAEVDASLLGLAVPYGVVAPDDPRMRATVAEIERSLHVGGAHASGVRRYTADTYYGGGEWILLAAWLGWYYAVADKGPEAVGRVSSPDPSGKAPQGCFANARPTLVMAAGRIAEILAWIEGQASPEGYLPEQVPANLNDPAYYPHWVAKWGPIASPLLWSHAEYIILKRAANKV